MNGQRGQLSRLFGRALVGLAATALAVTLLAPSASASPIGDAEAAMMAAWEKAGGDTSTLGARKGDVYPVGDGFALEFDGGKMFYTPATGAKYMFGPILAKYESLGGPANSDLGFPTINEVPGLAGPDSRVSTFAASDNPVIFWTPDHGAFVVRGALNAAWDKLGSSGGVLGAPIGDETYDGEVTSQKFTGGEVSWNRKTKEFTTNPAALAEQLKGLQVAIDPTAAINMSWRAAGGANGPLGAKKGAQYPIGGDGVVQDFTGGKIFFSPATGANAVEGPILQKYEAAGGPVSSDLGFPTANEADGGITPASRIATFSAADKPVIFWTPDHGAYVVRGAMKAAWDKLKGPTGKLGAPVGDQTVDGDVISQKFTGGKISWNRAKNSFTTDPANLAPLLSGLQVSGQNQPSNSTASPPAKKFTFHWWWLVAAVPVLLLLLIFGLVVLGVRRRRTAGHGPPEYEREPERDAGGAYESRADVPWGQDDIDYGSERFPPLDQEFDEHHDGGSAGRVSWSRGGGVPVGPHGEIAEDEADADDDDEYLALADESYAAEAGEEFDEFDEDEDPDAVGTTPIPVVSQDVLGELDVDEPVGAESVSPEAFEAEVMVPQTPVPGAGALDAETPETGAPERFPDAEYLDAYYADVEVADTRYTDVEYADVEDGGVESADAQSADDESPDFASPPDLGPPVRTGRHAAAEPAEYTAEVDTPYAAAPQAEVPTAVPAGSAAVRPTIHLPLEDDPYRAPDGYPIKASARFGLYYTPSSALYHDTLAEIWFATEDVARANGFVRAD
ncbi:hypothetical protein [Mycobacterium vicinigordonae]|uniref:Transmembrane alanine and glycine rich protein n=1 Tax=Mycobacterium vicinigordonae TaxID=1719132 RepID=A0A7D6I3X2_9MYCO|nr:hypothetical protein [Mycobacterium vicinigordonae]QLL09354.1 hypothetical protein H0P51_10995 [Mycobacterium vicinigordonae]